MKRENLVLSSFPFISTLHLHRDWACAVSSSRQPSLEVERGPMRSSHFHNCCHSPWRSNCSLHPLLLPATACTSAAPAEPLLFEKDLRGMPREWSQFDYPSSPSLWGWAGSVSAIDLSYNHRVWARSTCRFSSSSLKKEPSPLYLLFTHNIHPSPPQAAAEI